MADGIDFAGQKIATDEVSIGSVTMHVQRNKLIHGVDDANDGDVARTNPLPVQAIQSTDLLQNGSSQLTPKFKVVALAASGDLVTAVSGKKIRVLEFYAQCETEGTVKFQSGADSDLTGAMKVANLAPLNLTINPFGHFETVSGEGLNVVLATTNGLNGYLVYVEV